MNATQLIDRAADVRSGLSLALDAMSDELETDWGVDSLRSMLHEIDAEIERLSSIIAEEYEDELREMNREYVRSRI